VSPEEIVAALLAAKTAIDGFFTAAEHITPTMLQGPEKDLHAKIDAILGELDTLAADLPGAISTAIDVVNAGRGPTTGGADATLS
jgi:hypothetical protein